MDSASTHICENCNTEFVPYRGMSWQRFCSPSCRSQHYERYVRHSCADALRILDSENITFDDEENISFDDEEGESEKSAGG